MDFYHFVYELSGNHNTCVFMKNKKNRVLMNYTMPKGLLDLNIDGVVQQFYIHPHYFNDILLNLAFMNDNERLGFYNNVVEHNSVDAAYLTFIMVTPKF